MHVAVAVLVQEDGAQVPIRVLRQREEQGAGIELAKGHVRQLEGRGGVVQRLKNVDKRPHVPKTSVKIIPFLCAYDDS